MSHILHASKFRILKKEKTKAVIKKKRHFKQKYWPENDTDFICFIYFQAKIVHFQHKKSLSKRYEWTLFLDLHKELRNASFFFSLSDFSLRIVVQLMVICKKKFFHSILHTILLYHKLTQWHSLSFAPVKTVDTTLHEAHCTIITETKRNWWKKHQLTSVRYWHGMTP